MNIIALGHNHYSASLELREKVTFTSDRIQEALEKLNKISSIKEVVIISTCNRNEIYCLASSVQTTRVVLSEFIHDFHHIEPHSLDRTFYSYLDAKAVEHLYSVASGADSLIVGETQIFSQVKDAFRIAKMCKCTGPVLNRLFQSCFETSKTVRRQTRISQGAVSVSFAAAQLARKIFQDLTNKTVLLMGAGETSELTARNLAREGVENFIVVNRTFSRARELAESLQGKPVLLDDLEEVVTEADILIGSTSASSYILSYEDVSQLMAKRKNSPLFIIDVAVPRDIDPRARKLYNVFLYDMDDLSAIARENRKKREKETSKAKIIISQAVDEFMRWYKTLDVTPTIVSLREYFEQVRKEELEKYTAKLSAEDLDILERVTRDITNKLLHSPSVEIKRAAKNGEGYLLTEAVRKLFKIGDKGD